MATVAQPGSHGAAEATGADRAARKAQHQLQDAQATISDLWTELDHAHLAREEAAKDLSSNNRIGRKESRGWRERNERIWKMDDATIGASILTV